MRSPRKTLAEVREAARAERDIEIADFLDGYAGLVDRLRAEPVSSQLATAVKGLASSIRAGLVDDGAPG